MRLKEVVRQNPWWKEGGMENDPDLKRAPPLLLPRRDINLKEDSVYTIEGPRRVGKTLWMKIKIRKLLEKGLDPSRIGYFLVERALSRKELARVLDFFMERGIDYLFLDEVQGIRDWALEVKRYREEFPGSVVVVTGSPLYLDREREALLGRGIEGNRYFMHPFLFGDFARTIVGEKVMKDPLAFLDELLALFREYFITGGFPKPLVSYHLQGTVEDRYYLEIREQVKRRADEPDEVEDLARYLVERLGSVVSLQGIAHDFEKDVHWVKRKVEFLAKRHMLFEVRALGRGGKPRKRGEMRKFYFTDHSVASSLLSPPEGILSFIESDIYPDEEWRGRLLENIVASHLRQSLPPWETLYFKRSNGETDFVVGERLVEVKHRGKRKKNTLVVDWEDYDEGVVPAPVFLLEIEKNERYL